MMIILYKVSPGNLKIRAWNARKEQKKKEPVPRYIDEVWPGLKP